MEISSEQLESFRSLYIKNFSIELTPQEALEKAFSLLGLMKIIYRPITEEQFDQVTQRLNCLINKT
ncbi:MAG: hypothetical protein ACD_48C00479G0003 [uncultured bacterium]|nr:MAG: hypothetical protein ACD_48C00479G0003 [uncultured bacterium]